MVTDLQTRSVRLRTGRVPGAAAASKPQPFAAGEASFSISCDGCVMRRSSACDDCVMTYLCADLEPQLGRRPTSDGRTASSLHVVRSLPIELNEREADTLRVLHDAGLAPELRHRPR